MNSVKKVDAGWNDPPQFSYSETLQHSNSPKRTMLNKRIAFPLNSNANVNIEHVDSTVAPVFNLNLPPPPKSTAAFTPCTISSVDSTKSVEQMSNSKLLSYDSDKPRSSESEDISHVNETEVKLEDVSSNLDVIIEQKKDSLEEYNKFDLVKTKFQIMEESWKNDKFSSDIKHQLLNLTEALKSNNKEAADKIQRSLMVDHPKLCSEFISAFRLLNNLIN